MSNATDVAIIGAGPYGLSIAAHLRESGVDHRIIGSPMQFWRTHMPRDMQLKSEGFASDLYDPRGEFKLRDFCAQRGIAYADIGKPVDNRTFCEYGLAFQQKFAPQLEERTLVGLDRLSSGFRLQLDNGERFYARRVVLAVGIGRFAFIPEHLRQLPPWALSHSSQHTGLEAFRGRDVVVLGAGASAIDLAALLHEGGAQVRLVTRRAALAFAGTGPWPTKRSLLGRIRTPMTGIGPGWKSRFYCDAPLAFYRLPASTRTRIVKTYLGPAGCYFTRERVIGRVPLILESTVERVVASNGRVNVQLAGPAGTTEITTDHVIAATGYKVDVRALDFLSDGVLDELTCLERTPVLSTHFESSVPGLYFVGITSANSFGPMFRFAFGAGFTARRLSKHLAATAASPGTFAPEAPVARDLAGQVSA